MPDVVGDVVALVHELGVGLDQADELLAAHLLLAGRGLGVAGDQRHDVVVIDDGGGKQHELEIELPQPGRCRRRPCPAALSGVVRSPDRRRGRLATGPAGMTCSMLAALSSAQVGVLVELGLEPLHFLEQVDELGCAPRRP